MKKATALILTAALLFAFCACGKEPAKTDNPSGEKQPATENTAAQESQKTMKININGKSFDAEFYDNETAKEFADMLPLKITMKELNGNEKYCYLGKSLSTDSTNTGEIRTGDIMLYGSDCLVLFYDTFNTAYSYTRIGYITDTAGLKNAVGSGSVTITFEK